LRVLADGQYVVRIDEGQLSQENALEPALRQGLLQGLEKSYADCDLVVVSDYCYGVVNAALIERLRQLHQAQPKVLLVDSKALEKFRDLKATIVTPNYAEARQLIQKNLAPDTVTRKEPQTVEALGKQLASFLQAEYIAITLGQQGVFLVNHQGEAWHLPAYPVVSANDVGAGDSFASASCSAKTCQR
jgi:D-beta-D-heptose 7-phosphate kinase/D-beta-D-heptose 1-phosphate adenosyltransferase